MIVLIPAYEPDERLTALIEKLQEIPGFRTVVVDDGSGIGYKAIFDSVSSLGAEVVSYEKNKGKGGALKTGFKLIAEKYPDEDGIVTADCDGQHTPEDIKRIAEKIKESPDKIVMGCRSFTNKVPFRNRMGNLFTVSLFAAATGTKVSDTQTGLRGFTVSMIPWLLSVPGNRFEYEQRVLCDAKAAGYGFTEVAIETIYDKENYSSHYRPFADSVRVLLPILKYFGVSFTSFLIDYILVLVLEALGVHLFIAVISARVISSLCQFTLNKIYVFKDSKKKTGKALVKYAILAAANVLLSYCIINFVGKGLGIPTAVIKPIGDSILFCVSYWIQRKYIFS